MLVPSRGSGDGLKARLGIVVGSFVIAFKEQGTKLLDHLCFQLTCGSANLEVLQIGGEGGQSAEDAFILHFFVSVTNFL
jgi:hypothetical protein